MENEFIPYEQALALKALGFDEPCLAKYAIYNPKDPTALFPQSQDFFKGYFNYCKNSDYTDKTAAPLYQQAFRWFREKYGLLSYVDKCLTDTFRYNIDLNGSMIGLSGYKTYEEAELACLRKLIEIVKNK